VWSIRRRPSRCNHQHQPAHVSRSIILFPLHLDASDSPGRTVRLAGRILLLGAALVAGDGWAQQLPSPIGAAVPNRYLVIYRNNVFPTDAQARVAISGAQILNRLDPLGIAVLQTESTADEAAAIAALRAQPNVAFVIHDRILTAHALILAPPHPNPNPKTIGVIVGTPPASPPPAAPPIAIPTAPPAAPPVAPYDTYYTFTPQSWAVVQAGGYGGGVAGGPAHGPWDITHGAGVRIAILDSGLDSTHPDIAPNLAFSLSEIDQSPITGLPSPCDDGSPQDQQGHGTWTASLAAGAMGPGTGLIVGVAPSATLLNIKVIERLPDPASSAPDIATQCATGQASGLLSWVIQGIQDAIAQHADVISLSLGMVVDLETGEGAGLQAIFDRVTYAASQAGAVVIASAGNDGLDLFNPRYIELPAQARGVLAVVASTNPGCAEDLAQASGGISPDCAPGPVTLPYYSNFGAPLNAIAAPGGSYPAGPDTGVSGWVRGACSSGLANTADGPPSDTAHSFGCFNLGHVAYVQAMGTSASAALAAGAAALIRAANPSWTSSQIIAAMRASASQTQSLPAAPLLNTAALMP
jgi:subtilisin family serine protease